MTPKQIKAKLLSQIKALGTTVNQIRTGRYENPFPVGCNAVYLASKGIASEVANKHLEDYFYRLDNPRKDKVAEMVELLHYAKFVAHPNEVHTKIVHTKIVQDFLKRKK